jgi:outer membrane protein assembly factor BamA
MQILKYFQSNKNQNLPGFILSVLILILLISSCHPTKYVPEGETLLDHNRIIINNEGLKKSQIEPYIRQKPNKRIFGARFHLGLYNLSNLGKEKWPHNWLRSIGEEPVIFDVASADKSKEQIGSYLSSKGYFDSRVSDSIQTSDRRSSVSYQIDFKKPYTISNLSYDIDDPDLAEIIYFDTVNCLIERGKPYDVDILQEELSRVERYVKDLGFYSFSRDYVNFKVDSTIGNRQVNIYYGIKRLMKLDDKNRMTLISHPVFKIRDIYIYPDFVPKDALERSEEYINSLDTVNYMGYNFVTANKYPEVKFDIIIQSLYLKPGSSYNVTNTDQTRNHLLSLKIYRLVNIFYNEIADQGNEAGGEMLLDCNIQLTLLSQQSFKVEVEGTNTAGNLGGALNFVYQHKNIFKGAEQFNMKLKAAYEALSQKQSDSLRSTQEYGVETSLVLPKFVFPFLEKENFIKKYNPVTTILAAYNYQEMPFYVRTIANATFGYSWHSGEYHTHMVNPLQMNLVDLVSIDPDYEERIAQSTYLAYSYKDVMILGGGYSYIFNNQKIKKSRDYFFLRVNAETAGNIPSLIKVLGGASKTEGSYNILGQPFAQYFRTDFDLRYNIILNDVSSIVYRGYAGVGIPYGNSRAIPFEKQYFGGGANGLRAWQVRSLGPGSYKPDDSRFPNQTADIKLEANAEYRFKLFWILEGALFLEAGNIWTYNKDESRPGSEFSFSKFYKDLAVGTGTGLRFDLKFVLMRVDLGFKLRDPVLSEGSRWTLLNNTPRNFSENFAAVVAIGYPF